MLNTCLISALLLSADPQGLPEGATPRAVVDAALSQRSRIRSLGGRFALHVEDSEGAETQQKDTTATVWFDSVQGRTRSDIVTTANIVGVGANKRMVECINCEKPGHVITWYDVPNLAATFTRPERGLDLDRPTQSFSQDPRLFGYVSERFDILYSLRVDSHVASRPDAITSWSRKTFDGVSCVVMRSATVKPAGTEAREVYFDPTHGMHPVKIDYTNGRSGDGESSSTLTEQLRQVGNELWYPHTIVYSQSSGGRVTRRERLEAHDLSINQVIPAVTFTVAGLNLPNRTVLNMPESKTVGYVWQDGKVIPYLEARERWREENPTPPPEPTPLDPAPRTRYWLYALGAVLAVAAVALLLRVVRRAS